MLSERKIIPYCNCKDHDRELVVRLINNDEDAFCELYAKYKQRLLFFAMKFVKQIDIAEDIYQDAFSVIWQSRRFLDPEKSFSSYLFTIVKNRLLNTLRDIDNHQKLKAHIVSNAINYADTTNQYLQFNELNTILNQAMQELTSRQRQVLEMSRNENMSHKEIAEILNISVLTVQEHISIALKNIKKYLHQYPDYFIIIFLLLL